MGRRTSMLISSDLTGTIRAKTGHNKICRDFIFTHGNEHACSSARLQTDNGHWTCLLIFMCKYKILTNLVMLVNARFLPKLCPFNHYYNYSFPLIQNVRLLPNPSVKFSLQLLFNSRLNRQVKCRCHFNQSQNYYI